jgi:hypothetical protein
LDDILDAPTVHRSKAKLAGASRGPIFPIGRGIYILHHPTLGKTSKKRAHHAANKAREPEAVNPDVRIPLSVWRSPTNFDEESRKNCRKQSSLQLYIVNTIGDNGNGALTNNSSDSRSPFSIWASPRSSCSARVMYRFQTGAVSAQYFSKDVSTSCQWSAGLSAVPFSYSSRKCDQNRALDHEFISYLADIEYSVVDALLEW